MVAIVFIFSPFRKWFSNISSVPAHTGVASGGGRLPCCLLLCYWILEEDELKHLCKSNKQKKKIKPKPQGKRKRTKERTKIRYSRKGVGRWGEERGQWGQCTGAAVRKNAISVEGGGN